MKSKILLLLSLVLLHTPALFTQPGLLDGDFDADGKTTVDFSSDDDWGYGCIVQSDNKIIICGSTYDGNDGNFGLVRFNPDGSLDHSFSFDGKVSADLGSYYESCFDVAVQVDGKILVAGKSNYTFALIRLNADGTLDNSFGTGGKVTTDIANGDNHGTSLVLQADGKIIVSGYSDKLTDFDFSLVRYNTDGTLDTSFGSGGKVLTDLFGDDDFAMAVALQPDGKILAAGTTNNGADIDFALVRYNADGTLDNTFSFDGKVSTSFGPASDRAHSVLVQPNGKIVVGGYTNSGPDADFALVRYNTDGTLDHTFNSTGQVKTDFSNQNDLGFSVALQPDGKVLLGGYTFDPVTFDYDFALLRYKENGLPDTTFGSGGIVVTDFGSDNDVGTKVFLQPDGRILSSGYTDNGNDMDFAVARYISGLSLGVVQFSDRNHIPFVYPNPIKNTATLSYDLASDERIEINLFDMQGRLIQQFKNGEYQNSGHHEMKLNFKNAISPGPYLLIIKNDSGEQSISIFLE